MACFKDHALVDCFEFTEHSEQHAMAQVMMGWSLPRQKFDLFTHCHDID